MPGAFAMGVRRPVGVVGAIAPWNAALILSARSIAAPLVLGNTVVLKPSEESPVVGGLLWGEIFAEAGLPAGVLNIVTHAPGEAAPIGDELVENPQVRRINFTGSTATGRTLAEAAGRNLKRVVLELGGSEPADRARRRRPRLRGRRGGVRRLPAPGPDLHVGAPDHRRAPDRRGVHRRGSTAQDAGLKAGDPKELDTIIGPLINAGALADGQAPCRRGGRSGRAGAGRRRGRRRRATRRRWSRDVPAGLRARADRDVRPGRGDRGRRHADEAVARANATTYGLSPGIITSDPDRGLALAEPHRGRHRPRQRPAGDDEPQMPFGGVKDSGWGRFGGTAAMDEFTELRWITVQTRTQAVPVLDNHPPRSKLIHAGCGVRSASSGPVRPG